MKSRIREWRAKNDMYQRDLAAATGIAQSKLSAYERRKRMPSVLTALRLAAALGCQVEDIFELEPGDTK